MTMAWEYGFDGEFYRHNSTLTIELEFDEDHPEVDMAKLSVMPLRFAGGDIRAKLDRRGRVMWTCRHRNLIAYYDKAADDLSGVRRRNCYSKP